MRNQIIPWQSSDLKRGDYLLSASSLNVMDVVPHAVRDLHDVNGEVDDPQFGVDASKRILAIDGFKDLVTEIRRRLDFDHRFVIVDGLNFHLLDEKSRNALILGICSVIGKPTPTDQVDGKVIWDVKPREYTAHSNTTFSEHNEEAEFHTDTQFFSEPERYFSLWCQRHARDGGGLSGLADGRYVKIKMESNRIGREVLEILTHEVLPFRVPSVFTEDQSDDSIEIFMAPVFCDEPFLRYRRDTIAEGIIATGAATDPKIENALKFLEQLLNQPSLSVQHFLREGQVVFGNNHELLHNRTSFIDNNRHLIRVRMAESVTI